MNIFKHIIIICGIIFSSTYINKSIKLPIIILLAAGYTFSKVSISTKQKKNELVAMNFDDYKVLKYYSIAESIQSALYAISTGMLIFQMNNMIIFIIITYSISIPMQILINYLWSRNTERLKKCVYMHVTPHVSQEP